MTDLLSHLTFLFGADKAPPLFDRLQRITADYRKRIATRAGELTERDAILITYGDQLKLSGEKPLQPMGAFCNRYLNGVVSGIHILPSYPWTSDDGLSVMDYRKVDPNSGDWEDISSMQSHLRLMFDGVLNHISSQSEWFKGFLRDDHINLNYLNPEVLHKILDISSFLLSAAQPSSI